MDILGTEHRSSARVVQVFNPLRQLSSSSNSVLNHKKHCLRGPQQSPELCFVIRDFPFQVERRHAAKSTCDGT